MHTHGVDRRQIGIRIKETKQESIDTKKILEINFIINSKNKQK